MRQRHLNFLNLFVFFLLSTIVTAQDNNEKLLESVRPGKNHELLSRFEGKWKQNALVLTTEEPTFTKGSSLNEVLYGGRYLKMTGLLPIMDFPVNTTTIFGYDNIKKKFFIFIYDELSTQPIFVYGDYDKKTDSFTFQGTSDNAVTGKPDKFRIIFKFDGDSKYTYQVFVWDGKKEIKKMEIVSIKIEGQ